jgi:hypothetical protein
MVAFFASPLILICWAGDHVSLKITGWPRWRLFAASLAGEAFIVWIRGGPVPALAASLTRRTDLAVPDPATATRAVRRERDRRQARRLVERVRSSETNSQTNNALGCRSAAT